MPDSDENFDEQVLRSMARWPDVPACYGWLSLDRRGRWLIQGEVISHAGAIGFLGRNYAVDERGCWFVQNGPQRAFVALEYAPWIIRFDRDAGFSTHTQRKVQAVTAVFSDENGNIFLGTEHGCGLLDDRDLAAFAEQLDEAAEPIEFDWQRYRLPIQEIAATALETQFGFVAEPQAPPGDDAA